MTKLAWVSVSGTLAVCFLFARELRVNRGAEQHYPAERDQKASEIVAMETAVWQAAKEKDLHRFSTLVGDDALMIFTSGVVTKSEYLRSIAERNITSYSLRNFRVFTPAADTAIIVYEATITGIFQARPVTSYNVRGASVWVRRSGQWVAVLNQETPMS
ncbi:MAG TPA: nuclear transport factor 2 family protein [Candidatus Acidoferrales bacterium]|nr:nuclear transport factor 2 family protein [Candidatus Acidoferrales bacterium]